MLKYLAFSLEKYVSTLTSNVDVLKVIIKIKILEKVTNSDISEVIQRCWTTFKIYVYILYVYNMILNLCWHYITTL